MYYIHLCSKESKPDFDLDFKFCLLSEWSQHELYLKKGEGEDSEEED